MKRSKIAVCAAGFALAAAALALLFLTRFPVGPGLRYLLAVLGIIIAAAAAVRPAFGLAVYAFFLLTANNWPYFFNNRHALTYIPVAAVLFVFLAVGWLVRRTPDDRTRENASMELPAAGPNAVGGPLRLAAAIVSVSAVITVWRWLNFFPLSGGRVYDWMTNTNGLPASGARLSTLMGALSYLLPFALFWIVAGTAGNRRGLDPALRAVSLGLGLAIVFGFVQHFAAPGLGNTDFWIFLGQINATFKDPNAFGGVLTVLLPLLLGLAIDGGRKEGGARRSGMWPAIAAVAFVLGIIVLPWTGARSALLALAVGLAVFAATVFLSREKKIVPVLDGRPARKSIARVKWFTTAAALLLVVFGGVFFFRSTTGDRLVSSIRKAAASGDVGRLSPERYYLWKHALGMTRDYPVSGVGVGAFLVELPDYYAKDKTPVPAGYENYQRLDSAENYFLQAAAELGLVGLAVLLAVLAGLVLEIKRGIRRGVLRGSDRWIFTGAVGGIAGFVVNALFHSFAQSFETLFCFWFTAAVAVVCGRSAGSDEKDGAAAALPAAKGASGIARILGVTALVVFSGVLLWNSFRSLSIAGKSAAFGISQEYGLYRSERSPEGTAFRWTRAEAAWTVNITGRRLLLPVTISHPDTAERPVRVRISLGKNLMSDAVFLGEIEWTQPGRKVLEFTVPPGYSGEGMIMISVDRTWVPGQFPNRKDPRNLGAAVEKAEFAGEPAVSTP